MSLDSQIQFIGRGEVGIILVPYSIRNTVGKIFF
jgi:hypothetical protein